MDEQNNDKMKSANLFHEKARFFRGRFLNSIACIERKIAIILTEYFCIQNESKKELFFHKVAEKLTLQKKKEILVDILKQDYPNYWEKNKRIYNDLQSIQEFRNKLAHSIVDVSDEALSRPIEEGVGFIQWKEGTPITDKEFEDWDVRSNMVYSKLFDIEQLLPYKEKTT